MKIFIPISNISLSRAKPYAPNPSDYLVIEDKNDLATWHLPIRKDGKLSRQLMGAAKAALTVGYRGNKYEGPKKREALKKLKKLYQQEGMEWD